MYIPESGGLAGLGANVLADGRVLFGLFHPTAAQVFVTGDFNNWQHPGLPKHKTDQLIGQTSIYILPGYDFKTCDALITNFHQPGSTLMLLVAAFVGKDWKKIYEEALVKNYRFLSYGDSSLLFRKESA